MDRSLKIALIGHGRFGKKYFKEIKKLKKFNLVVVFVKSKIIRKSFVKFSVDKISKYNLDGAIIATPPKTHLFIAKEFIKKKIPIIIEKPATLNFKSVNFLNKLSIQNKTSVIINYSDLFNLNFLNILKNKNRIGKINYAEASFGKLLKIYNDKNYLPYFDWLPHPLAMLQKFFNLNISPNIIKNVIYKKKNKYFQILDVDFYRNKKKLFKIFFSNSKKIKKRQLLVYGDKGIISYDGYNQKNNYILVNKKKIFYNKKISTLTYLLLFFHQIILKQKYYSNLKQGMVIHKLLEKLSKKL
jgi:predicted dehydrogenase